MRTWSFYDPATGLFAGLEYTGNDETLPGNTPDGHAAAEGRHDHLSTRVDIATGTVVGYRPLQPSPDHEWNATAKRWQLTDAAQAAQQARQAALAQIATLEGSQARAVREALIGAPDALDRLREIDAQIAALRSSVRG